MHKYRRSKDRAKKETRRRAQCGKHMGPSHAQSSVYTDGLTKTEPGQYIHTHAPCTCIILFKAHPDTDIKANVQRSDNTNISSRTCIWCCRGNPFIYQRLLIGPGHPVVPLENYSVSTWCTYFVITPVSGHLRQL